MERLFSARDGARRSGLVFMIERQRCGMDYIEEKVHPNRKVGCNKNRRLRCFQRQLSPA